MDTKIHKGSDLVSSFKFPQDLSEYANVFLLLFNLKGQVVKRAAMVAVGGFPSDDVEIVEADSLSLNVHRAETSAFDIFGTYTYQVRVAYHNVDFYGSQEIKSDAYVGFRVVEDNEATTEGGDITVDTPPTGCQGGGADGLSAYELAVNNGFVGTESEWLLSLVGADGLSAYELAVENGFVGTESEWLLSLKGADGGSGAIPIIPISSVNTADGYIELTFDPTNMGAKKEQKIVLIGSSTAEGTAGLGDPSDAWGKIIESTFSKYINTFSYDNIALGGTTTYTILPSGTITPADRPNPTTIRSITHAVETLGASIVLCASPSNDANNGYSAEEIITNWEAINNYAINNNVVFFQMGSNPRNLDNTKKEVLYQVEKALMKTYPNTVIPMFNILSDGSFELDTKWNSGDGIHYNRNGHLRLANEMINKVKDYIDKNSFYRIEVERSDHNANDFFLIGSCEYGRFTDISAQVGTTYDYRTKVVDFSGASSDYSNIVSMTVSPETPELALITNAVSDITSSSATFSGDITSIAVGGVSAHGFVYGTSPNPTINDTVINNGATSITGSFSNSVTGLTDGQLYYVRAYAEDAEGITYGNQVSFTAEDVVTAPATIRMNFNEDGQSDVSGYFSAYGNAYQTGISFSGLTDINGAATSIGFEADAENAGNETGWGWSSPQTAYSATGGYMSGNDSGLYPDDVLESYWYVSGDTYPNGAVGRLTGLDDTKSYELKFTPSRAATGSRITNITIDGVTKSQEAVNNATSSIDFTGLTPVNGVIEFNVVSPSDDYAYLNVLEIIISA